MSRAPDPNTSRTYTVSTGNSSSLWPSTYTTTGVAANTQTFQTNWGVQDPQAHQRIDELTERLEKAITLIEKLEIEARYWHIKADELGKILAANYPVTKPRPTSRPKPKPKPKGL